MQEDFRLIVDLVLVLAAAAAGGLFASLLRQPVILGYLLGGIVVGPAGLGLIKELIQVDTLAEFGVAFLLFALGVEFSFAELQKVKAISLGGGLANCADDRHYYCNFLGCRLGRIARSRRVFRIDSVTFLDSSRTEMLDGAQ